MTIGENIRRIRLEKALTQAELGKMLGVNQSSISSFENSSYLRNNTIRKIANALGITTDELLSGCNCFQNINNEDTVVLEVLESAKSLNEFGKTELLKFINLLLLSDSYRK